MASPGLSALKASSITATALPSATQNHRSSHLDSRAKRGHHPAGPPSTSRISSPPPRSISIGALTASASLPQVGSVMFGDGEPAALNDLEEMTPPLGTAAGCASLGNAAHGRERSSTVCSTVSRAAASSLLCQGHGRYPSSTTSGAPERPSSSSRTASHATSSSAGSSDSPLTPAQLLAHAPLPLFPSSLKGKERAPDVEPPCPLAWQDGVPVLSAPMGLPTRALPSTTSPVRGRMQAAAVIDPGYSFPMRRGGPNASGSGSGSGSGGASRQGIPASRSQPIGLGFRSRMPDLLEGNVVSGGGLRRRGSSGPNVLGGSGFDANSRIAPYTSSPTAAVLAFPRPSAASSVPSLFVPSPVLPTSPITSAFTMPETPPAASLLPTFETLPRSTKTTKRSTLKLPRRASPKSRLSRRKGRTGRLSSSSSSSSARHRSLCNRSASLPNLRDAAADPLEPFRRPSIPLEPRGPLTRSPRAEQRSRNSIRRGSMPLIFPSKPVGVVSRHRPHASEPIIRLPTQASSPPRTKRSVVPVNKYEMIVRARPRLVIVDTSPCSSTEDSGDDYVSRPAAHDARSSNNQPERRGALTDADIELFNTAAGDRSSMRRVLRENDLSRAEREIWSDSTVRGIGFGLSLRLAEREQQKGRRSLAAEQCRAEQRRVRQEVTQRKRREASEPESGGEGRLRPHRLSRPDYSPPMPTSFEPFAHIGHKLSLSHGHKRERRLSLGGAISDGTGLGIVNALKRARSKRHNRVASVIPATGAPVMSENPSTPRMVRGRAIRHLRTSVSLDSLYSCTRASAPTLPPLPGLNTNSLTAAAQAVTTQYGQALTSPSDEPTQPVGALRRPSATAQNAFLSLPPRLHHLLRYPEHESYMPSRPAPTIPFAPQPRHLQEEVPRSSTPDSVVSPACPNFALEEHLLEASGGKSPVKSVLDLPVATTAPLVWCYREQDQSERFAAGVSRIPPSHSMSVQAPMADSSLSPSGDRLVPRFSNPFTQPWPGSDRVTRKPSQRSQQSSTGSVVNLTSDGNWNDLFFFHPRHDEPGQHRLSHSIESVDRPLSQMSYIDMDSDQDRPDVLPLVPPGVFRQDNASTARLSSGSRLGRSSGSFLRVADDSESEGTHPVGSPRREVPSLSFMEFSPPLSAQTSPGQGFAPNGLAAPLPPGHSTVSSMFAGTPTPVNVGRGRHLSLDLRHFINPLRRTSSSPFVASDGSRLSTLDDTMDKFPSPPVFQSGREESGSDGDDEDEDDWRDDNVTNRHRTTSIASLPVHRPSPSMPDIAALPVVADRPVSSTSWFDFSDSEGR
ncbi:hypothetical protein JCM3770_001109 [Rhodotorula araucariae]